jgi:hypothetical protein
MTLQGRRATARSTAENSRERNRPVRSWIGWGLFALAVFVLLASSIFSLPGYLVDRDLDPDTQLPPAESVKAKNDIRSTLLQGIGGLVLFIGAIAALRQLQLGRDQLQASREQMRQTQEFSSRQLEISDQSQITGRFSRSIEQLASDRIEVRIGGIYGLELLAEHPAINKEIVTEILLGLVHRRSPWPPDEWQVPAETPIEDIRSLWRRAADVADAVRVIGRLPVPEEMRPILYLGSVDLRRASLKDADLAGAYLGNSNLARAELQGANLRGARLQSALLTQAELQNACLEGADLQDVNLREARLADADLSGANLEGSQLSGATANPNTRWPNGFDWKAAGVRMG